MLSTWLASRLDHDGIAGFRSREHPNHFVVFTVDPDEHGQAESVNVV